MTDDNAEDITNSDHAQIGTEPVGVYLSQEDAAEIAEALKTRAASSDEEELPRLIKLLEDCEHADAALHVSVA